MAHHAFLTPIYYGPFHGRAWSADSFLEKSRLYKSVSAFAPIVTPSAVPWGQKAFTAYLGPDESTWLAYDACALIRQAPTDIPILIDQGTADNFLEEQLQPERFQTACAEAGQPLTLRLQEGYDHSYYFIASFMEDHLRHHGQALK